jgi:hypothetical protein
MEGVLAESPPLNHLHMTICFDVSISDTQPCRFYESVTTPFSIYLSNTAYGRAVKLP